MTYKRKEIIGDCTLYLGESLKVMSTLDKVDAVVTDPPYGLKENAHRVKSRGKLAKTTDYGSFDWDKKPASDDHIDACLAAADECIIFGGNYFKLPPSRCWLIWDKENGGNDFADCEMAWTNIKGSVRLIRHMWNGMIRASEKHPRVHPTQKPIVVMKWVIEKLKGSADTILDPFMGSGTTGVACVKLGRKFIGIELDENYFNIACERIRKAYEQPDLFIEPPKVLKQEALFDAE